MRRLYNISVVLLVFALLAAFPAGASAADYQSLMKLGKSSLESGNYASAEKAFGSALEARPDDREATLYMGIALSRQDKLNEAESYLKRALFADPTDPLANLELGRVYQKQKVYVEAKDFYENVNDLAPGSDHSKSADKLLAEVNSKIKASKGRRWSLGMSTGLQYDTNVVLNAEGASLPGGISRKGDIRALVTVAGSYQTPDYKGFKSSIGYSFYQSLHNNLSRFNVQSHLFRLGGSYEFNDWLMFRGTYSIDITNVGGDRYSQASIFSPSLFFKWHSGAVTTLEYKFTAAKFIDTVHFPTNSERNGDSYRFTVSHITPVSKSMKFRGRYYYQNTNARVEYQKYDAHSVKAALLMNLPYKFEAEASWEYLHREYEGSHPISGFGRRDDANTLSVSLKRHILTWLTVSLDNVYIRNESNIAEFDYVRNITGVILTARY